MNTPIITDQLTATDKLTALLALQKQLAAEGLTVEDLQTFQAHQAEVKENPVLQPQDLAGATNEPAKDNEALTAELAELKRRFNNLVAAHYEGNF